MDDFKEFLDRSSIGGLNFISSTKNFVRLFWILIVIASFTFSFIEVYNMFQDWKQHPIKTTTGMFTMRKTFKNNFKLDSSVTIRIKGKDQ